MEMEKCQRYDTCSIPDCPLDSEHRLRLKGEKVCRYYKANISLQVKSGISNKRYPLNEIDVAQTIKNTN